MPSVLDALPADALPYFQLPSVTYPFVNNGATVEVAQGDPNRALIIFGTAVNTESIIYPLGLDPINTPPRGFYLGPQLFLTFSFWIHGPIVCYPWFATGFVGGNLTVLTHALTASAEQVFGSLPLPKIPSAPVAPPAKVQGRLAQLWHTLTGR